MTAAWLVLGQHWVGVSLALGGVGGGDAVNDGLGLFVADFCGTGQASSFLLVPHESLCTGAEWGTTYVDSSRLHFVDGCDRCYELCARS